MTKEEMKNAILRGINGSSSKDDWELTFNDEYFELAFDLHLGDDSMPTSIRVFENGWFTFPEDRQFILNGDTLTMLVSIRNEFYKLSLKKEYR